MSSAACIETVPVRGMLKDKTCIGTVRALSIDTFIMPEGSNQVPVPQLSVRFSVSGYKEHHLGNDFS